MNVDDQDKKNMLFAHQWITNNREHGKAVEKAKAQMELNYPNTPFGEMAKCFVSSAISQMISAGYTQPPTGLGESLYSQAVAKGMALEEEVKHLKATIARMDQGLGSPAFDKLVRANAHLEERNKVLDSAINTLQKRVNSLNEERERMVKEIDDLDAIVGKLQNEHEQSNVEWSTEIDKLKKVNSHLAKTANYLEEVNTRLGQDLERDNHNWSTQYATVKDQRDALSKELFQERERAAELSQRAIRLKDELDSTKAHLDVRLKEEAASGRSTMSILLDNPPPDNGGIVGANQSKLSDSPKPGLKPIPFYVNAMGGDDSEAYENGCEQSADLESKGAFSRVPDYLPGPLSPRQVCQMLMQTGKFGLNDPDSLLCGCMKLSANEFLFFGVAWS